MIYKTRFGDILSSKEEKRDYLSVLRGDIESLKWHLSVESETSCLREWYLGQMAETKAEIETLIPQVTE
jgi:hypothetical protein